MKPLPFLSDAEVAAAIPQVVKHLGEGGLLAYPTETVYGFGSRAVQPDVAALGGPLTSTSANLPGQPPGPGAAAIARDFAGPVEKGTLLVLDGGVLGNRPPSTVVDCTRPRPQIVREGTLSVHELRRAVGRLAP